MQKINLYMPIATYTAIKKFAELKETSAADIIRSASADYVRAEAIQLAKSGYGVSVGE